MRRAIPSTLATRFALIRSCISGRCGSQIPAILLLLAAPAVSPAQAATPARTIEWERITLPFDETMPPLLQVVWLYNPATRSTFVGANGKGLFESKDGGASWNRVDDGSFQVSSINTDSYTLQSGPNGVLHAIDISSGVYRSDDAGKHWTMAFPMGGIKGRVWIDPDRPTNISLLVTRVTESESGEIYIQLKRSTNAGVSFEAVDIPSNAGSVDVSGDLICYEAEATVRCSENLKTWKSLSLASIEAFLLMDKEMNSSAQITIDSISRELLIMSGGTLFETRNGRTVIAPKVDDEKASGHTIDLVVYPGLTFPAYGVSRLDTNGQWTLTKLTASGEVETHAGPKTDGFRLRAVDFARDIFFVWTGDGYYRGVLK